MALGTVESAENSSLRAGPARMGKFGAHPSTREFGSLPGRMTPRCYRLGGDKPLSGSRTLNHLWAPTMSSEHEERSRLHRLALTVLSAMQCFTAITASVPRILPGEVDSIEGWAFGAAWIFSAFSPVLLLYLARRAGFFLGLLAVVIIPIFLARFCYLAVARFGRFGDVEVDLSMWANDFLGLFSVFILLVLGAAYAVTFLIEWIADCVSKRDVRKG